VKTNQKISSKFLTFVSIFVFLTFGFLLLIYLWKSKLNEQPASTDDELTLIDDGLTLWYNSPVAAHYKGKHDRTYYSYLDLHKRVTVGYYEHKEQFDLESSSDQNTSQSRILHFIKLHKYYNLDDHGAPAIWVVNHGKRKGHILAFYCLHSSPLFYRTTTLPENITFWSKEQVIDSGRCTYVSIAEDDDGTIFVFYTLQDDTKRWFVFRQSMDGGLTWNQSTSSMIDFGSGTYPYVAPVKIKNGHIHMIWSIYRPKGRPKGHKNIYYAMSNDKGKSWQSNSLQTVKSPIKQDSFTPLYIPQEGRGNVPWNIEINSDDTPFITFVEHAPYDSTKGWKDAYAYFSRKVNAKWETSFIDNVSSFVYPSGAVIDSIDMHRLFLSKKNKDRFTIHEYHFDNDTGEWNQQKIIYENKNEALMNIIVPVNRHEKAFTLMWLNVRSYLNKDYDSSILAK
jgi:hypothetical protein